jgi:hypothetical protein
MTNEFNSEGFDVYGFNRYGECHPDLDPNVCMMIKIYCEIRERVETTLQVYED